MNRLGRLFALPWLLIALAVQALAPADAAAMRPDLAALGICSAHDHGGSPTHRPDPANSRDHDCCAFACAVVGLGAVPPAHASPTRVAFATPARLSATRAADAPAVSPLERPRARAPPSSLLTI